MARGGLLDEHLERVVEVIAEVVTQIDQIEFSGRVAAHVDDVLEMGERLGNLALVRQRGALEFVDAAPRAVAFRNRVDHALQLSVDVFFLSRHRRVCAPDPAGAVSIKEARRACHPPSLASASPVSRKVVQSSRGPAPSDR